MTTTPQSYLPCLRWKMGEYQALHRSREHVLDFIVPLIEVAEVGFDFEKQAVSKSVDEHLSPVARRIYEKLGKRPCFVDMRHIDPTERMAHGAHPATFVFDELRNLSVPAIPAVDMRKDDSLVAALKGAVRKDRRGILLRVRLDEVARQQFPESLQALLGRLGLSATECHLALDLEAPNFQPADGFVNLLTNVIGGLPYLDDWQSFSVIATSFPITMAGLPAGLSRLERHEWKVYKSLLARLRRGGLRLPRFGDYGIAHPAVIQQDPRYVKPYATVRYSIDDAWLIARGRNVRDHRYGQFRELCSLVINSGDFEHRAFSSGDGYIADCAAGLESTGNLTTWRWVGTNHHLARVVGEISSLNGTSSSL